MSHKVNPKAFRIKELKDWDSRWFSEKNYQKYLKEDCEIRDFLNKELRGLSVENIEIERFENNLRVIINTARPALVIGRNGSRVTKLKEDLEEKIDSDGVKFKIEVREVKDPWSSASLTAQWIAQQIEKRMHYRRVLKKSLGKASKRKDVEGIKIEVSGRLNGADISRREWVQEGSLPRQNLRAKIDFARVNAYCKYGVIGIKVYIYKGKKFEEEE